jgi:hypothetical protein
MAADLLPTKLRSQEPLPAQLGGAPSLSGCRDGPNTRQLGRACEAAAPAPGVRGSSIRAGRAEQRLTHRAGACSGSSFVPLCAGLFYSVTARIHPGADLLVLRKLPWQIKIKRIQLGAGSLLNRGSL